MAELAPVSGPVAVPWRSAARWRAGTPRGRGAPARSRVRLLGSLSTLALLVAAALLVPWLVGVDDRIVDYTAVRLAPSLAHPFGTDEAGRNLLVRSLAGLRISLLVAAVCAVVSPCWARCSARCPGWPAAGPTGCSCGWSTR